MGPPTGCRQSAQHATPLLVLRKEATRKASELPKKTEAEHTDGAAHAAAPKTLLHGHAEAPVMFLERGSSLMIADQPATWI